ncbi:hypothetical protein BKA83DRAFT_4127793 [Pisolithus microcarpus]|nr:hypothetical protein BKA83DRAFT_4127793 [Pisolithus microcarpus]
MSPPRHCVAEHYIALHARKAMLLQSSSSLLEANTTASVSSTASDIFTKFLIQHGCNILPILRVFLLLPILHHHQITIFLFLQRVRGLAKQARENRNLNEHVGHCKCARLKQPTDINQNEDSSGIQMDANETAGHVLSQPPHPGDGAMDVNDPQSDRDPIDPIDNNFSPPPSPSQSPPQDETDPCLPPPPPPLHSPPTNLCAHHWHKQVQSNGSTEEFQKYYTSLTSAQRQAYDDEAAALASGNNWHMKTISSGPLH